MTSSRDHFRTSGRFDFAVSTKSTDVTAMNNRLAQSDRVDLWVIKLTKPMNLICARSMSRSRDDTQIMQQEHARGLFCLIVKITSLYDYQTW